MLVDWPEETANAKGFRTGGVRSSEVLKSHRVKWESSDLENSFPKHGAAQFKACLVVKNLKFGKNLP
jgi:hypothetical protein